MTSRGPPGTALQEELYLKDRMFREVKISARSLFLTAGGGSLHPGSHSICASFRQLCGTGSSVLSFYCKDCGGLGGSGELEDVCVRDRKTDRDQANRSCSVSQKEGKCPFLDSSGARMKEAFRYSQNVGQAV